MVHEHTGRSVFPRDFGNVLDGSGEIIVFVKNLGAEATGPASVRQFNRPVTPSHDSVWAERAINL
jgi:hypothetical protein